MAGYQDVFINQGEDYNTQITLYDDSGVPYDLRSFTVASYAKKSYYAANASLVFNSTVYDANNGIIQLSANNAVTANLDARQKLVYDVFITDTGSGIKTKVLEGQIIINPGVTIPGSAFGTDA